jgi:xyloglucan-specific exo-beta-1,4-glucanase
LTSKLRTLAATAGKTHLAHLQAGKRRFNGISVCILGLTFALLAACGGGGGGGSGDSPPSPPPVTRPGVPTAMTVSAGNNQVSLSWGAVAGATSYKIYRSTTAGQQGSAVGTSSNTSFVDTTAVNGTTYLYQVTAVNAGGEGSASTQSAGVTPTAPVTLPAAPNGVSATLNGGQVTVTWAAVTGATSYNVYRSTTQGTQGASVGSTATTNFVDSTVVNGTAYYYQVTAVNSAGEGTLSIQATASGAAGTSWRNAKFGGGGYVTGLIFHPTSANVLYARTDIGGAYRWHQATMSWVPITDGFGAAESFFQGVESIALDPNDDQLVYMSTGLYNSAGATARLYISSDRGDHWTSVNLPFSTGANNSGRAIGERMMVDPNLPSTLFYGSRTGGLWKSTDSGRTWAQVTSLSSVKMSSGQINAAGGSAMGVELVVYDTGTKATGTATQTIYTAVAPDYASVAGLTANLYKSTNGGASWAPVATPVSGYHIPHMVRAADGMFYVAFTQGTGPGAVGPARLYKFDGTDWTLLNSTNSFGYGGISVFGTGTTTRIALGVSNSWGNYSGQQIVQLSDDDGQTWREIEAMMPHTPAGASFSGWVDDIEIDPSNRDHILHINGGGVVETRNASSATPGWAVAVDGIEENAVACLVAPPAGAVPYIVINSAGDIGTWIHTDLTTTPTLGPDSKWNSAFSADMAWSDPLYIATIGVANWNNNIGTGFWSGDGGRTWTSFATPPAGATTNPTYEASIAVTARNNAVWAPSNSVPSYTTNNGASWASTNLPTLPNIGVGIGRGYHLVADRKSPNKVYAYDSGGQWWGTAGKVYVSTDGGHTFTQSAGAVGLAPNHFSTTSLVVNPNAEGDLWLADGNAVYHSTDSGASWQKLSNFASIWGSNPWPDVQGATAVALGKAKAGATYSAAVYVVGVVNGVWGVYRSDDGGATWARFNDDAHQFGGIGVIAADQNVYGRLYITGNGRGVLYSN